MTSISPLARQERGEGGRQPGSIDGLVSTEAAAFPSGCVFPLSADIVRFGSEPELYSLTALEKKVVNLGRDDARQRRQIERGKPTGIIARLFHLFFGPVNPALPLADPHLETLRDFAMRIYVDRRGRHAPGEPKAIDPLLHSAALRYLIETEALDKAAA